MGINVGGMQFNHSNTAGKGDTDCAGPAAKVHRNGGRCAAVVRVDLATGKGATLQKGHRLIDQKLRATTRNKDSRFNGDPEPAELCPAKNVLKGIPGDSPLQGGG
jgi:hypothetical protein